MLDDFDLTPGERDRAPLRGALSASLLNTSAATWLELGVEYRAVSAFAFRSFQRTDQWGYFGRGLADNFSDYDRLTVSASVFPPIAGLRVTPIVQLQRKGEGDWRDPLPEDFLGSPTLFLGTRERTARVGLRGSYQPLSYVNAEWDAGMNFVSNADHREGRDLTEFQGVVRLSGTWSLPR